MRRIDSQGCLRLSEAQVQRACIDLLRAEGWIVRPAPRDARKAARGAHQVPAGEPDLIAVKPVLGVGAWLGVRSWRVLLVECKAADGRLSTVQRAWAEGWGVPVAVVRSVEDLREAVRAA